MSGPAPPDDAEFARFIEMVRDHAVEVAMLDAPRAEAWASDVLALAAEIVDDPVAALAAALNSSDDGLARAAIGALVDLGAPSEPADFLPDWIDALGTSRCEGAWMLTARGAQCVVFRFRDALDTTHVISVDLAGGPPEQVGDVAVGPGDLLAALDEEDAGIDIVEGSADSLARRVGAALEATERPSDSAVVNGHLLVARLAAITGEIFAAPRPVDEAVPPPPVRDPDDDAYALDVLRRTLGEPVVGADERDAVAAVVDCVAPDDLEPFTPAERDAVLMLEWADWLGAVIMLVREGPGAGADGHRLVDLVNRCPEVTTTIPARDRDRFAWAFTTVTARWSGLGLVEDGVVTERGTRILPAALALAWGG